MTINSLLFTVQNMAPAMLGVGVGRVQNYDNLASLVGQIGDTSSTGNTNPLDTAKFTYDNISNQILSDMAGVTAETIKEYPKLEDDYVIAIIDDGTTREARVYSRSEILDNFDGTEEEKKDLENELNENPLMVFNSDTGLPPSTEDAGSRALAENLNDFLDMNRKIINVVDKEGFDPFAGSLGSTTMKKILAEFAQTIEKADKDLNEEKSKKIKSDMDNVVKEAIEKYPELGDDYVIAVIDDGITREARVYSRSDILDNFDGSAEEKEALEKKLDESPFLVFNNDSGLPPTASDSASQALSKNINDFLKTSNEALNELDEEGYDPFIDILGSNEMYKIMAYYAHAVVPETETDPESEEKEEPEDDGEQENSTDNTDEAGNDNQDEQP